jgi:hypothetical protein
MGKSNLIKINVDNYDMLNNILLRSDIENGTITKNCLVKDYGVLDFAEKHFGIDVYTDDYEPIETYTYDSETEYKEDLKLLGF